MLKIILGLVVIALVAVIVLALKKPDVFRVQRSAVIKAAPETLFALVNDFHQWAAWSPYEKLDPAMKREFSGAASGQGAAYAWDGKGKAGAGRMEILQTTPASRIDIQLDFSRPMTTRNQALFTFVPQGDATLVSWSMQGPAPFISKLMQVFFDLDQIVGKDFDTGLANLKALAEK